MDAYCACDAYPIRHDPGWHADPDRDTPLIPKWIVDTARAYLERDTFLDCFADDSARTAGGRIPEQRRNENKCHNCGVAWHLASPGCASSVHIF